MKRAFVFLALVALPGALVLAAKSPQEQKSRYVEKATRGKYLVAFGGCSDCHTPVKLGPKGPEPDLSRFLSGHPERAQLPAPPKLGDGPWSEVTAGLTAWSGPWGISYAANLTPDQNTGLGSWTEEIFLKAMRTGKHYGVGREILPPMPWQNIAALSDEDIKAIYAYLRTLTPIKNRVPDAALPGRSLPQ